MGMWNFLPVYGWSLQENDGDIFWDRHKKSSMGGTLIKWSTPMRLAVGTSVLMQSGRSWGKVTVVCPPCAATFSINLTLVGNWSTSCWDIAWVCASIFLDDGGGKIKTCTHTSMMSFFPPSPTLFHPSLSSLPFPFLHPPPPPQHTHTPFLFTTPSLHSTTCTVNRAS